MSHQEEPPLESYQLTEYEGTASAPPSPFPPVGYSYSPTSYPIPLVQAATGTKKPLFFPLTRNASVGKQVASIAVYSILMTVLFVGNSFLIAITQMNQMPGNIFIHRDGTANGFFILVLSIFLLLTLPATSLLSGALFGAVRAALAAMIIVGTTAGLWFFYAWLQHVPVNISFNSPVLIAFILVPLTAALVGFFYDRRRYAAWWHSFLTLLLGSACFVTVMLTLVAIFGHPADVSALAGFYIIMGCFGIVMTPLIALPIAGIEGGVHAILVARKTGKSAEQ